MSTELQFNFNFDRTLQAAAYLLKLADKREMTYIHLLKLLYIADRQYLAERGYPLTGDKVVAMKLGPVLSQTLDLIKGTGKRTREWQHRIQTLPESYGVRLVSDPGNDDLSRASMSKLDTVFEQYGHEHPFDVVDETHEFTEWQEYYRIGTSTPIPLEAILRAQNAETMLRTVEEQVRLHAHQKALQEMCG